MSTVESEIVKGTGDQQRSGCRPDRDPSTPANRTSFCEDISRLRGYGGRFRNHAFRCHAEACKEMTMEVEETVGGRRWLYR